MPHYSQFQGCDDNCDEVYPPAEDTYLLLRAALNEALPTDLVLEVGCGSGIISEEISSRVQRLIATDINPHALHATRFRANNVDLVRTDLFQGIGERFDLVLFNPPYLPFRPEERSGNWVDRALDGGESGRETVNRFLHELKEHLQPGGRALLLISSLTGLHEVIETASSLGLLAKPVLCQRCFFEQLYVLRIQAKDNNGQASLSYEGLPSNLSYTQMLL